jgi:hypothetical protein
LGDAFRLRLASKDGGADILPLCHALDDDVRWGDWVAAVEEVEEEERVWDDKSEWPLLLLPPKPLKCSPVAIPAEGDPAGLYELRTVPVKKGNRDERDEEGLALLLAFAPPLSFNGDCPTLPLLAPLLPPSACAPLGEWLELV